METILFNNFTCHASGQVLIKNETDQAYGGFRYLLLRALTFINNTKRKSDQIKTLIHRIRRSIYENIINEDNSMARYMERQLLLNTVLLGAMLRRISSFSSRRLTRHWRTRSVRPFHEPCQHLHAFSLERMNSEIDCHCREHLSPIQTVFILFNKTIQRRELKIKVQRRNTST